MKILLLFLSAIVTVGSIIPYLRDIVRGITKPNLVSWITWTLITGIATAAEIAGHEYFTAVFTSAAMLGTASVVAFGLHHGFVKYTAFDVTCQIAAIAGVILWQVFNSPAVGVIASVVIDAIGVLPTIRHAWNKPLEETWSAYAIAGIGGILGVIALKTYNTTSLAYPLYILVINLVLSALIVARRRITPVI